MATMCTATNARSRWTFATVVACAVLFTATVEGALPTPRGYVNDFADVIDAQREAQIDALVREAARTTSAEIVVVTVPTLDGMTVEEYASRLFAAWGIGKKGKNNGVLVLVAPSARAMRIEVGYGLEPVLPDGLAGEIIRTSFLPRFRDGDYSGGIADGVARVVSIVREGKRAAPGVVSGGGTSNDAPPAWLLVPFLSLFVAVGALATGASVQVKNYALLFVGAIFGGFPALVVLAIYPGLGLISVVPIAVVMSFLGYSKADAWKWRTALRGTTDAYGPDWTPGPPSSDSSSGSSSHSSSNSSSSDFGGGSSGGGGASGHW